MLSGLPVNIAHVQTVDTRPFSLPLVGLGTRLGLHMIIYYHCTRDSALLLSFLLTCHPYIIPFHFMTFTYVSLLRMRHVYVIWSCSKFSVDVSKKLKDGSERRIRDRARQTAVGKERRQSCLEQVRVTRQWRIAAKLILQERESRLQQVRARGRAMACSIMLSILLVDIYWYDKFIGRAERAHLVTQMERFFSFVRQSTAHALCHVIWFKGYLSD